MAEFKDRLKILRTEMGWSQDCLAYKLGTTRSTIGNYEQGTRNPDIEMLEQIADLFNVDMKYLLGTQEKRTQNDVLDFFREDGFEISSNEGIPNDIQPNEQYLKAIEIAKRYLFATRKEQKLVESILEMDMNNEDKL